MNKYLITNLVPTAPSFPRILASYNVYLARTACLHRPPKKPVNVSTRKTELRLSNAAVTQGNNYQIIVFGVVKMILPSPLFIRVMKRYPIFILLSPSRTRFMRIIPE